MRKFRRSRSCRGGPPRARQGTGRLRSVAGYQKFQIFLHCCEGSAYDKASHMTKTKIAATAKKHPRGRRSAETKLKELKRRLLEISDLHAANAVLGWDQATYM